MRTTEECGVSIAIPNWNHELALPRAIRTSMEAVAELKRFGLPAEVIVIDDHSRDGSLVLLRQLEALYYAKGLRVIAHSKQSGPVVARNRAIQEASFKYILFVDADNEIIPENVSLFVRSIQQTSAAVVYGNLLVYHPGIGLTGLISSESVQHRLLHGNYIDTCALYDRDQLRDVAGFYEHEKMRAHEDWELILHLMVSGRKIVFVPVIMGKYNYMPSSNVTGEIDDETIAERHKYLERVFDQSGLRAAQRFNSKHLRYHPDVGYI